MKINIGDTYTEEFSFNQNDVEIFSNVTKDKNPLHLDSEYTKNTIFKKPIIHGFLGASIFSRVFGTKFPGEGTIYLKQDLKFLQPMYVGEKYFAYFEITDIQNKYIFCKTTIKNNKAELLIDGNAKLIHIKDLS